METYVLKLETNVQYTESDSDVSPSCSINNMFSIILLMELAETMDLSVYTFPCHCDEWLTFVLK